MVKYDKTNNNIDTDSINSLLINFEIKRVSNAKVIDMAIINKEFRYNLSDNFFCFLFFFFSKISIDFIMFIYLNAMS